MLFTKDLTQLLFVPANKEGAALLPNTTDTVPTGVFSHSTQLTSVSIGESCTTYTTHSGILYTKDMTTLIAAPAGYGDSVVIPEATTAIGPSAFAGLTLTTLVSLGTLTSIDPSAFTADTKANATVALINNETYKTNETLWKQAGFTHFTTLPTPGDITNPDPSAPEATGLTYTLQDDYTLSVAWSGDADPDANLTIPDTATLNHVTYRVASIAPSAFANRETLESVSIPSSITTISDSAFAGCINLSKATLPKSITTLGVSAFENTSLTKVFLPTTTTSLGNRAFANCASLTHVIAQSEIPSIAEDVLDGCTNVSVLTPKQPDDTYLWMTGIPSSGNHIEPYGITLADAPTTLEVGQTRDILKDATIATPKDTSLSYAYPATCVSVDNSGVVTAKAKGSADVLVSIMFDDYLLAEDSLTVTVEEPKATAKAVTQPDESIVPLGYAAPLATDTPVASGSGATFECAVGKTSLRCTLLSDTTVSAGIVSTTDTTLSFPGSVSYNGKTYTVTAIEGLYSNWSPTQSLTSLTIPSSVESIGNSAFSNCTSLTTLTFASKSTLHSIGDYAFQECKLTSLTIPASVESIGDYAFYKCPSLTTLTFAPNSTLRSIGPNAFSYCSLTSLTIPASVESIGNSAFRSSRFLTTVTFEQGSTPAAFGGDAFESCPSLTSFNLSGTGNAYKLDTGILMSGDGTRILQIPWALKLPASYTIPEGVVEISGGAFAYQTNLTSLTIPASVESIGDRAFSNCASLTTLLFAPNSKLRSIGDWGFFDSSLTSLTIPASVESIGNYAFYGCTSLTTLTFAPNSTLRAIGANAFGSCKLTSLTIPASVESIGDLAFQNNTSLATVTFEQRSTPVTFDGIAFNNCTSLTSFNLSGTGNAYKLDTGILMSGDGTRILQIPPALKLPASYTIPEGIVEISGGAFAYQTNLTSLAIPASVESIGNGAFYNCTSLTTLTFAPNSALRSIGSNAFLYCKLTSLTIPSSVESIGNRAFVGCTSLATVTFAPNSTLRSIGAQAFYNCKITSLTFPASVEAIGDDVFAICTSIRTVTFENYSGVIPALAFDGDTVLTSLYSYGDIYGVHGETASDATGQGAFRGITKSRVAIYLPDGIIGGRTLSQRQQTWKDAGFTNLKTTTDKVVSFDSRGGSVVPNQRGAAGFVPTKPENAKKAGSSFRGWYSDFACTIPWDFSTSIDKSVTLYANWGPPNVIDLATGLVYTEANDGAGLTVSVAEDGTEGCVFTQSTIKTAAIPETHDYFGQELPVIGITEGGFTDCLELTSVTFSGTSKVASIGKGAFSGCKALDSFPWESIPSLTLLGDYAFRGSVIASAELPAGIASVPTSAFEGCVSLARVTFAGPVTSINASAFAQCKALTSISLPAGLSTIAGSAFAESGLTAIVIPKTLTSLGEYAFSACTSLTKATFEGTASTPSSLKALGYGAFYGCTKLVQVTLPVGLEDVSDSAFTGCSALRSIELPTTTKTLGDSAFQGCTTLKDVVLPDSTQSIGKSAFADCSTLSSFVSPASLTSIGELAFTRSGVASVTLAPQGALTINSQAFAECSSLTTAVLNPASSGTLALGDAAFIDAINMNILKVGTHASNLVIEPTALSGCLSPSINSMIICEGLATDGSIARDAFDSTTKRKVLVALNPNDADNQAAWRTAGFTNFGSATSHTLSFDLAYTGGPTPPVSQTLYEGQLASKPKDPYRASYSFEGWFASDATTPWDFTTSRMGTTDITLTAKWKQGVDPDPVSVDVSIGDAIKLDAQGNATETEASFISRTDAPIYLASTTCTLAQDESNPVFANNAKGVSVTFRSPKGPEKSTGALVGSILSFGPATLPSFVLASKTSTATALVGLELTQAASVNYSPESRSVAVLTYTFARG